MEEKTCKDCKYFRQHYGLDSRGFFRVFCGHCVYERPKRKRPDNTCERFTPGERPEDAFVSKEYLSKELLQYILKMDLLPAIEDAQEKKPIY